MGSLNMTSLVHADKFVREGNLSAALALIRKVRKDDPSNRYAEAYEERVCALMGCPLGADTDESASDVAPSPAEETQPSVTLAEIVSLLSKAHEVFSHGDAQAALDILGKAHQLDPKNADIAELEDQIRLSCVESSSPDPHGIHYAIVRDTIAAYVDEATHLASRGDYDDALHLIAKGFVLDPLDAGLRECECMITEARALAARQAAEVEAARKRAARQEEENARALAARQAAEAEEARKRAARQEEENATALAARQAAEAEQARKRAARQEEENARALAARQAAEAEAERKHAARHENEDARRSQKLQHHIVRARELLTSASYDEALTEVALGLLVDAESLTLHALEQMIWKEKNDHAAMEASAHASTGQGRLIRLYILAAEEFARNNEFTRALDEVAKAYTLDPANSDVKRTEVKIRQQELRHHQQMTEPQLKLIYHHDRAANGE